MCSAAGALAGGAIGGGAAGSGAGYGNISSGSGTGTGYGSNTGSGTGTGYGSNTSSGTGTESGTVAKAKSYIPGTAENQASKGTGSGYSQTSGASTGYTAGTSGTGSGTGTGTGGFTAPGMGNLSSGATDTFGKEQAPQQGNAVFNADGVAVNAAAGGTSGAQHAIPAASHTGYGSGSNTGSNSGGGLKAHVPGTQQYKESHGSGSGTGSHLGRDAAAGTVYIFSCACIACPSCLCVSRQSAAFAVMLYHVPQYFTTTCSLHGSIWLCPEAPVVPKDRWLTFQSRHDAAHLTTLYTCTTGAGVGGLAEHERTKQSGSGNDSYSSGEPRGTGATGTGSNYDTGSNQGAALTSGNVRSHLPGSEANRERKGEQSYGQAAGGGLLNSGSGNTGRDTGYGSGNTGSGSGSGNTGSGSGSGNTGRDIGYSSGSGNTGSGNTGSGNTDSGNTGRDTGYGSGSGNTGGGNTGSGTDDNTTGSGSGGPVTKLKAHLPGTKEYKAAHGKGSDTGTGTGSDYGSNTGSGSHTGRDTAAG